MLTLTTMPQEPPGAPIPFGYDVADTGAAGSAAWYARPVSLDQLSYFVAVAEEGNIGRAARRLHISQPPLSRQIRSLEHELGISLFRRTTRGVQLLPAGHRLLPRARHILEAVANVRRLALDDDRPDRELVARGPWVAPGRSDAAGEIRRSRRSR
jgi:hypothetical protein